ncbi:MAG: hypothetical protein L6R41_004623 [Letrouitia leprolyta]|nr:MAG: hypothetical protein L6R41_004623 [Letrouitia leprolyta]
MPRMTQHHARFPRSISTAHDSHTTNIEDLPTAPPIFDTYTYVMKIHSVGSPTGQEATDPKIKFSSIRKEDPITNRPRRFEVISSPTFRYEIPMFQRPGGNRRKRYSLSQAERDLYDVYYEKYLSNIEYIRRMIKQLRAQIAKINLTDASLSLWLHELRNLVRKNLGWLKELRAMDKPMRGCLQIRNVVRGIV